MIREVTAVRRRHLRVGIDRDRQDHAAAATSGDDDDRDEKEEATREAILPKTERENALKRQTILLGAGRSERCL
jgi:hypothetical protein